MYTPLPRRYWPRTVYAMSASPSSNANDADVADVALFAGGEMAHQQIAGGTALPARRVASAPPRPPRPPPSAGAGVAPAACGRISIQSPSGENEKLATDGSTVFVPVARSSSSNARAAGGAAAGAFALVGGVCPPPLPPAPRPRDDAGATK